MTWTPLEIAANIMTAICIFLAGRNNVHTWWTGIVACVLFIVLFYTAKLSNGRLLFRVFARFSDKPVFQQGVEYDSLSSNNDFG